MICGSRYPNIHDSAVYMTNANYDPEKTVILFYLIDINAAMKNVLSPISETKIDIKEARKPPRWDPSFLLDVDSNEVAIYASAYTLEH